MHVWSTDAIRERERFSYWREALCQAVFNLTIEAQPESFSARIRRTTDSLNCAL